MYAQSAPFGIFASAGPDDQSWMLVAAMKNVSRRGAPGLETSLTSLRVTPVVSPSAFVDKTTPSRRELVLVEIVTVVPCTYTQQRSQVRGPGKQSVAYPRPLHRNYRDGGQAKVKSLQ